MLHRNTDSNNCLQFFRLHCHNTEDRLCHCSVSPQPVIIPRDLFHKVTVGLITFCNNHLRMRLPEKKTHGVCCNLLCTVCLHLHFHSRCPKKLTANPANNYDLNDI